MTWRIGTSGWSYRDWKGILYPEGTPQKRWFEIYAQTFDTVELNATFYRLMPEKTFRGWRDKAPEGFLFAVKMWRMITHIKKLKDPGDRVKDFVKRSRLLGKHMGPILVQLPPNLRFDAERLERFLESLRRGAEYAMEFRHPSWFNEKAYDLLRGHGVGLCIYHHVEIECPAVVTAPLVYIRFHGESGIYEGKYTKKKLERWADFIEEQLERGRHVAAYFNNDIGGHAVENARELRELLEKRGA